MKCVFKNFRQQSMKNMVLALKQVLGNQTCLLDPTAPKTEHLSQKYDKGP